METLESLLREHSTIKCPQFQKGMFNYHYVKMYVFLSAQIYLGYIVNLKIAFIHLIICIIIIKKTTDEH